MGKNKKCVDEKQMKEFISQDVEYFVKELTEKHCGEVSQEQKNNIIDEVLNVPGVKDIVTRNIVCGDDEDADDYNNGVNPLIYEKIEKLLS